MIRGPKRLKRNDDVDLEPFNIPKIYVFNLANF